MSEPSKKKGHTDQPHISTPSGQLATANAQKQAENTSAAMGQCGYGASGSGISEWSSDNTAKQLTELLSEVRQTNSKLDDFKSRLKSLSSPTRHLLTILQHPPNKRYLLMSG